MARQRAPYSRVLWEGGSPAPGDAAKCERALDALAPFETEQGLPEHLEVAVITPRDHDPRRALRTVDGTWDDECRESWDAGDVLKVRPLIVLNLSDTVVTDDNGAKRNERKLLVDMLRETAEEYFSPDAAALARRVADQIEAQTRPPRIPEPGFGGQVDGYYDSALRGGPLRFTRVKLDEDLAGHAEWMDSRGRWSTWDKILAPVLVRPGMEDAP